VERLHVDNTHYPIFLYNPHDIWPLVPGRSKSEKAYYARFDQERKYGFYVIGGTTALDKQLRKQFDSAYFNIDLCAIPSFNRMDHITVLAHYVITVSLPSQLAVELDLLYERKDVTHAEQDIQRLLATPCRAKVKIERNSTKAATLRKQLSKEFALSKRFVEEYGLF